MSAEELEAIVDELGVGFHSSQSKLLLLLLLLEDESETDLELLLERVSVSTSTTTSSYVLDTLVEELGVRFHSSQCKLTLLLLLDEYEVDLELLSVLVELLLSEGLDVEVLTLVEVETLSDVEVDLEPLSVLVELLLSEGVDVEVLTLVDVETLSDELVETLVEVEVLVDISVVRKTKTDDFITNI